jgi:hypothetical protein
MRHVPGRSARHASTYSHSGSLEGKKYASRHDRRSVVAHLAKCGRARATNVPAAMHRTTEPTRSSRWGGTARAPGEPVPAVRGDDHRCVILHIREMTTGPGGILGARGQSMRALGHWSIREPSIWI